MTITKTPGTGFNASLKPKLIKSGQNPNKSKIYSFIVPKFGRFAFTRDPGEASMFMTDMIKTHLGAIVRGPDYSRRGAMHLGPILEERDLGSGLVTNLGCTALANDSNWTAETAEPLNTLNVCKYMDWGKTETAAAVYQYKLLAKVENEVGKKEAVAATTSVLKWLSTGNAKIIVTGTLEALGAAEIKEWGLFSAKKTEGEAKKAATSTSATEIKDTAKIVEPKAKSEAKVRGAQQYVAWATEAEEVVGLVLKNTEEVITVPGWSKINETKVGATPSATSKYTTVPLMWDRRAFAVINLVAGNKVEFPYELTIESGT
jgi:hypothetical protein